jgi:glycosyltransferase involved in cell wall biosynthesis
MKSPWLSVIVPTYNGAAYLAQTLDSIAVQQDPDIEIIAVDDGSTDDTVAILRRYSKTLPIRVIEQGRSGNWVANSDLALRQAAGEYVGFLHQDDFWYSGRLALLRDRVRRSPQVALWLHPVWFVDPAGERLGRWNCPLPAREQGLSPEFVLPRLMVQNFVGMPAPLFRRDAALDAGGMDPRLWFVADWDLWLKLAERSQTVYVDRPLAAFRVHPQSQTVQRGRDLDDLRRQYNAVFQRHFPAWGINDVKLRMRVRALFDASTEVNLALMAFMQRQNAPLLPLFGKLIQLGPSGWHRLLRDSRLCERVRARWKSRLRRQP